MEMPINRYQCEWVGISMQWMHYSYKCMKSQKETKWVCIQLACSRRPRAFEEAHCWNIQAKFYNKKFPLVYESDKTRDSLSWRLWCYFEAQVWQRIVTLSLLSFSLIFYMAFLFFWAFLFYGLSPFLSSPHNLHSIPPIVLCPWLTLMYCVKVEKVWEY